MHSEQSSAPTSRSERRYKVNLSEADYLARELEDAKEALTHAMADVKSGLATSADLRLWVKRYPWAALGAASMAGFAAAAAVTPAPGESVGEKLSRLKSNGHKAGDSSTQNQAAASKSSGVGFSLTESLFDLAKTLVQTVILATMRNSAGQPSSPNHAEPGAGTPS